MGFLAAHTTHGRVVRMLGAVVNDLQCLGLQELGELLNAVDKDHKVSKCAFVIVSAIATSRLSLALWRYRGTNAGGDGSVFLLRSHG